MHRLIVAEYVAGTARKLGVALLIVEATTPEELDAAFASAAAQPTADAIVDVGDTLTIQQTPRVTALAAKHQLPATYLFRQSANEGGVDRLRPLRARAQNRRDRDRPSARRCCG